MELTNTNTKQQTHIDQLITKIAIATEQMTSQPKRKPIMARMVGFLRKDSNQIPVEVDGVQKYGTIRIQEENGQSYWAETQETISQLAEIEEFEEFAKFIYNCEEKLNLQIRHLLFLSSEADTKNWLFKKSGIWVFTIPAVKEIVDEMNRQKAVDLHFRGN